MRTLPFISTCVCDSIGVVPISPTFSSSIFLHFFNAWQGATQCLFTSLPFFLYQNKPTKKAIKMGVKVNR